MEVCMSGLDAFGLSVGSSWLLESLLPLTVLTYCLRSCEMSFFTRSYTILHLCGFPRRLVGLSNHFCICNGLYSVSLYLM